jgi:predicted Ser/Thr protein kinase
MGIVFLARDVALDRPVAIKLFPPEFARQPDLRARFLNEARTAARLSHPNIVPIHAVEEHGDLVFFVMAYVDGQTLTQRIRERGPLPAREATRILREVAWALVHAHAQGVVHRDIKPDNILIENGTGRALVTDFGIATAGPVSDEGERLLGTPEYMSPEQIRGASVDARSDLYSLGIVAFLTLSGRYPYPPGTASEAMAHHLSTAPPRLSTLAPGVPAKLGDLIDRCLRKDPEQRAESATDLADRLGAALEDRHQVPVPVRHFVEELKRRSVRNPAVYAVIALLFAPSVVLSLMNSLPLGMARIGVVLIIMGAVSAMPLTGVLARVRRLLRAGYGRDDILQALRQDLEHQHEELAFLYGERYREDARRLRRIGYGALGAALAGALGIASMVIPDVLPAYAGVAVLAAGGAVAGVRADRRSDKKARDRVKFWKGRVGAWLFRVAGIRLKRVALPSTALTARPTELAVGAAVVSLYESLPADAQRALPGLRRTVEGLEEDAQRMRGLLDECDATLEGLEGRFPTVGDTTGRVAQVRALRDQAAQRMQQAVAALETLRVDLLRLTAGTVALDAVTTRLGTAREVAADLERLLDAREEVDRLLEP